MAEDDNKIPVNPDLKPRTVPEALGLTDRKAKAVYQSIVEAIKTAKTPEVISEVNTLYSEINERVFAAYCLGARVSAKGKGGEEEIERRVKERLDQILPQIVQQVGQQAAAFGQMMTLNQLEEAEKAGVIKIVRTGKTPEESAPVSQETEESSMPDSILYGNTDETPEKESDSVPEPKKKSGTPAKDEPDRNDPMYG